MRRISVSDCRVARRNRLGWARKRHRIGVSEKKWKRPKGSRIDSRTLLGLSLCASIACAAAAHSQRRARAWAFPASLFARPARAVRGAATCMSHLSAATGSAGVGGHEMRLNFAPAGADTLERAPWPAKGDASVVARSPARFSCQTPKCRSLVPTVGYTDRTSTHRDRRRAAAAASFGHIAPGVRRGARARARIHSPDSEARSARRQRHSADPSKQPHLVYARHLGATVKRRAHSFQVAGPRSIKQPRVHLGGGRLFASSAAAQAQHAPLLAWCAPRTPRCTPHCMPTTCAKQTAARRVACRASAVDRPALKWRAGWPPIRGTFGQHPFQPCLGPRGRAQRLRRTRRAR